MHNTVYRTKTLLSVLVIRLAALGLLAAILMPAPMSAQPAETTGTGGIEGIVYNSTNGLPVGRAKVGVKGTSQETLTDDEGRFRFPNVPAGEVELEVSYLGFDPQAIPVTVEAGRIATRDFQLVREGSAKSRAGGDDLIVLDTFEVVADRTMTAQALAMNEQRHAANIKNVVALDDLGDFGTENIGDYIRFMPGVAIIDDGEDAGRLSLGGFPPEMSNVQLDGGEVASSGVGETSGRSLALQEVPMMNVERVEVTKVPTPDMPAAGLGGSLNLVTKSLLGTKRPSLEYSTYMNFTNREGLSFDGGGKMPTPQTTPHTKKPSFQVNMAVPLSKKFAFSAGISRSWRQRATENTPNEVSIWNLNTTDPQRDLDGNGVIGDDPKDIALATAQWRQDAQISVTESVQLGAEWKMSRNDTLSFSIQSRQVQVDNSSSRLSTRFHYGLQYDPVGNASESSTKPGVGGTIEMGQNADYNYSETTNANHMTLHYKHRSTDWHVDVKAFSSSSERVRASLGEGYFSGVYTIANQSTSRGFDITGSGINQGESILPTSYTVTNSATGESVNPFDGANGVYAIQSTRETDGLFKEDRYTGRVDAARIFSGNFSLQTGAYFTRLEKDDNRVTNNYSFVGDQRYGADTTAGRAARRNAALYDVFDEDIAVDYYGNDVRWISPVKVYQLFQEHPEYFEMNSSSAEIRASNSKLMIEDIGAAYLRFDLKLLHSRLQITGGVRYEKTKLDGWSVKLDQAAIYQRDPETGIIIRDQFGTPQLITTNELEQAALRYQTRAYHDGQSYDDFYPSLNANYSFSDNLVLRAAYARTVGRPDVKYVVAGVRVPDLTKVGTGEVIPVEGDDEFDASRTITVGNPGLLPWTADSFHLSLDSYHLKGGFGSVGVYRKDVTNFFAERTVLASREVLESYGLNPSDIDFMLDEGFGIKRWENVGNANLTGLEVTYRQDLFFLPPWLQKTQVWMTYTHLDIGGPNAVDFIGFSPESYSWGVDYIRPRFRLAFDCAFQAETKTAYVQYAPGTQGERYIAGNDTYEYQSASTRYGIRAEYSLSRAFALYLTWNNIFDDDSYRYRRAPDTPDYAQNYKRTVSPTYIQIGVKGQF